MQDRAQIRGRKISRDARGHLRFRVQRPRGRNLQKDLIEEAKVRFGVKPRVFVLTLLAMVSFASNSLLCRAALRDTGIDAATFTFVRILAGAVALWLIVAAVSDRRNKPNGAQRAPLQGDWPSAFALFVYAAAFSFAYNSLSAGTGALLLFGAVQATMILWGFHKGERLDAIQIVGLAVAVAGLVVLVFPGISAPPLLGSILMLAAGLAWGVYSLRGKGANDAIAATTGNFLRAVPFAIVVSVFAIRQVHIARLGIFYAIISGAITSGLGYVIWYTVLPQIKATSAAVVQLSAPVLVATGGILLLSEPINLRYVIASIAILGGIFLVIIERKPRVAV
jgi:drug/metabolite transporter (DMT)-like permease